MATSQPQQSDATASKQGQTSPQQPQQQQGQNSTRTQQQGSTVTLFRDWASI